MDAPAMLTHKHVPQDVGLGNVSAEEGGQQQLHREEKQHKPVMRKVKDRVKKIKNTLAGHGHGNGNGNEHGDDHEHGSNSNDEDEEDAAQRQAEVEKGGYMEDVEDKPVLTESDPGVHGAPVYDSERIAAATKEVKSNDDASGVRLGDLGGPVVEDSERIAAATKEVKSNDDAPGVRLGDLGGPVVEDSERIAAATKEVKSNDDAPGVRLGDLGGPVVEDPAAARSTTPTPRGGEDIGTTDVVRDFEKMNVRDDPSHVGAGKMGVVDERTAAMPVSDGTGEEWKDAPADTASSGGTYMDRLRNTAAGTTEYGKKLATTVYEKVAGVGTVVASKTQQVTPGFGAGGSVQDDSGATTGTPESMTAGAGKMDVDEPRAGAPISNTATDATTEGASGGTYTDKIKSAAAGTTEYGKQLASTVYEKVAGVGTAVTGKVQQTTPSVDAGTRGVGAKGVDDSSATATPGAGGPGNRQDKGVTGVTAYIAEKLRPGDEERSLSEAITGAVQQRKEGVGSTAAKAREGPAQAMTMAREAVTSLTGGNRVSETVQPTTEGNIKEGVAMEGPKLRGEEIGAAETNTNIM